MQRQKKTSELAIRKNRMSTSKLRLASSCVVAAFLALAPVGAAYAIAGGPSDHAFLGGGNALSRALSGESKGLSNADSTSDLLAHLTFASSHGGRAQDPGQDNATSTQGDDNQGDDATSTPDHPNNGEHNNDGNGNATSTQDQDNSQGKGPVGGLDRAIEHGDQHVIRVLNANISRFQNK